MSKICDRSPCDELLGALGVFIFGISNEGDLGGFVLVYGVGETGAPRQEVDIEYCPFCGTRLEEINAAVVKRFTEPRDRRGRRGKGV